MCTPADQNIPASLTCRSHPPSCARFSYDLTHSLQKLHSSGQRFYTSSLYKRVEKRFCWNQHLQANLGKYGEVRFTPPHPATATRNLPPGTCQLCPCSRQETPDSNLGCPLTSPGCPLPGSACRCNDMNCR